MLSIVIPTLNAERTLVPTLAALVPAAMDGIVRDVVIADGGSADATLMIAEEAGCEIVAVARGRGPQMRAGAAAAKAEWLLFLHADTVLEDGWQREVAAFVQGEATRDNGPRAACFSFRLDATGWRAWLLERIVALRCRLMALPYGDQGLLIHRSLFREAGGYPDIPLMEDVALVRAIGRRRLAVLNAVAVTSAERYRRHGYAARMVRNAVCLTLYFVGVPPRVISRLYG